MQKEKREYRMTNSSTIAAAANWYPFSEDGAPTAKEVDDYGPFYAVGFENQSGESYDLVLDPVGSTSRKMWRVPDGSALTIENRENIKFYGVLATNKSSLTSAAGELKLSIRNY